MKKPKPTAGLRHVALWVKKFEACTHFYTELLDMQVEWQPDDDNVYLTSGNDNLAIHRLKDESDFQKPQRLDHIGFIIDDPEQVFVWHDFLKAHNVTLHCTPKDHRDGARSFYCEDPDGNCVQMIYHPPLSKGPSDS